MQSVHDSFHATAGQSTSTNRTDTQVAKRRTWRAAPNPSLSAVRSTTVFIASCSKVELAAAATSVKNQSRQRTIGANNVRVKVHRSAESLPGYRADRDAGATFKGECESRTDTVHIVAGGFRVTGSKKKVRGEVETLLREEILVHKGLGLFSSLARKQKLHWGTRTRPER